MPVQEKIETILKEIKSEETTDLIILKKLLKNLLPKQQAQSFSTNEVSKPSEEEELVVKMLEILDRQKTNSLLIRDAFLLLNYRYEVVIKKSKTTTKNTFVVESNPAQAKRVLDRSQSLNDSLFRYFSSEAQGKKHRTLESKSSPVLKKPAHALSEFNNLNETLKAFLSVFEEYRAFIKNEVQPFFLSETQHKTSAYVDVWGSTFEQYLDTLLQAITNTSVASTRSHLLKQLIMFTRWMPDRAKDRIGGLLATEITSGGDAAKTALTVILELKNQLSQESLKKIIINLLDKASVLINDKSASLAVLYDAIIVLLNLLRINEKEKVELLNQNILQLLKNMRSSQSIEIQPNLVKLYSYMNPTELKNLIDALLLNLQNTDDTVGVSAMCALTELKDIFSEEQQNRIISDLSSFLSQPTKTKIYIAAHAELMKLKKYFSPYEISQYFIKLFDLLEDTKQDIELRKSSIRGIVNLMNASNIAELVKLINFLIEIIQSKQETSIKLESIKTFITLKQYLVAGLKQKESGVTCGQCCADIITVLLQTVNEPTLANEIHKTFAELKSITPLNLQKEVFAYLNTCLRANPKSIDEYIFQALLQYKDGSTQPEFDQLADELLDKWHEKDEITKMDAYQVLDKMYELFSPPKRSLIAAQLLKQLKMNEVEHSKMVEAALSEGYHADEKVTNTFDLLILKTLATYAYDIDRSEQISKMNYLHNYTSQKNTNDAEARILYMRIYMVYRNSLTNISLSRVKCELLFGKGENQTKQTTFLTKDLIEHIHSFTYRS